MVDEIVCLSDVSAFVVTSEAGVVVGEGACVAACSQRWATVSLTPGLWGSIRLVDLLAEPVEHEEERAASEDKADTDEHVVRPEDHVEVPTDGLRQFK